jgi:membrane peptidoglycan carboxypeptidase
MRPLAGAVRIRTTLQPRLQAIAEKAIAAGLDRGGRNRNASQAALVAMTKDGAVVAMVGGRSYADSQFNRAQTALASLVRPFKPFVYLAALRSGWKPEATIVDGPIDVNGWRPKNIDGRFHGEVTLEQAFARILNAATARLAQRSAPAV